MLSTSAKTLGFVALTALALGVSEAAAQAVRVEVRPNPAGGWQLLRAGKPYVVKGAGGSGPLEPLAAAGANSIRLWGVDDQTGAKLDEAHRLGLTVTVGVWLGHERHGFRYDNFDQVAQQAELVIAAVKRYKDHPAVLAWALGNEMEGFAAADNPAIWSHIDSLAAQVKALDPHHPTLTVIAEIGGRKVEAVHRLCPHLDVLGINSYAGAASLPERYRQAGGKKPYLLTEYGPAGSWEVGKTGYGAALEPTSTAKAASYAQAYRAAAADPQCLGSYAFTWGWKQEASATWFGMLLPGDRRTGAVDALQELWSGAAPANRCPILESLTLTGADQGAPGSTMTALLKARDPEGKPLRVDWVLAEDPMQYNTAGDVGPTPETYPEAIQESSAERATVRLPAGGGVYRLFAYVYDDQKNAAVANVPIKVLAAAMKKPAKTATLPLLVAGEPVDAPAYVPTGWMGDTAAIAVDEKSTEQPHSGTHCVKVAFQQGSGWGGVVWQNPPNDWGDAPGGYNLAGATRLTGWIRGATAGAKVKVGFGIIKADKPFPDTARGEQEITLSTDWQPFTFPLAGADLSRIKTGFYWVLAGQGQPCVFYLDDLKFE